MGCQNVVQDPILKERGGLVLPGNFFKRADERRRGLQAKATEGDVDAGGTGYVVEWKGQEEAGGGRKRKAAAAAHLLVPLPLQPKLSGSHTNAHDAHRQRLRNPPPGRRLQPPPLFLSPSVLRLCLSMPVPICSSVADAWRPGAKRGGRCMAARSQAWRQMHGGQEPSPDIGGIQDSSIEAAAAAKERGRRVEVGRGRGGKRWGREKVGAGKGGGGEREGVVNGGGREREGQGGAGRGKGRGERRVGCVRTDCKLAQDMDELLCLRVSHGIRMDSGFETAPEEAVGSVHIAVCTDHQHKPAALPSCVSARPCVYHQLSLAVRSAGAYERPEEGTACLGKGGARRGVWPVSPAASVPAQVGRARKGGKKGDSTAAGGNTHAGGSGGANGGMGVSRSRLFPAPWDRAQVGGLGAAGGRGVAGAGRQGHTGMDGVCVRARLVAADHRSAHNGGGGGMVGRAAAWIAVTASVWRSGGAALTAAAAAWCCRDRAAWHSIDKVACGTAAWGRGAGGHGAGGHGAGGHGAGGHGAGRHGAGGHGAAWGHVEKR
ncbi:unnamed protein product [Closterium sp. NIES-64]|nr:unnamed protein product [Closterium sp. NIES-64]